MSMMMALVGPANAKARASALSVLRMCGATANLKLLLDAGDEASYTSGQNWLDLSGGGYDFYRGANAGADALDPAFSGTAGKRSSGEYFVSPAGDYFTYDSTNEAWMNDLHKDNAAFTMMSWFYPKLSGSAGRTCIFSTLARTNDIGVEFAVSDDNSYMLILVGNGTFPTPALAYTSGAEDAFSVPDQWNLLAMSQNEASGVLWWKANSLTVLDIASSAYSSPSSSAATETAKILNGSDDPLENSRIAQLMIWSVALTPDQMNGVHMMGRGRYSN